MSGIRKRVAIVGGARTPFAKIGTTLKDQSAVDLGAHSVDGVLEKYSLDPGLVDDLVYGIVVVDPSIPHMARESFPSRAGRNLFPKSSKRTSGNSRWTFDIRDPSVGWN